MRVNKFFQSRNQIKLFEIAKSIVCKCPLFSCFFFCSQELTSGKSRIFVFINGLSTRNGEQGWRSGESARLPEMWSGFDSAWYHMWVEFVVGSRPCSEGFSPGSPVFLPP